jgi:hypothetical protein
MWSRMTERIFLRRERATIGIVSIGGPAGQGRTTNGFFDETF